jgi:hypothetical protein
MKRAVHFVECNFSGVIRRRLQALSIEVPFIEIQFSCHCFSEDGMFRSRGLLTRFIVMTVTVQFGRRNYAVLQAERSVMRMSTLFR